MVVAWPGSIAIFLFSMTTASWSVSMIFDNFLSYEKLDRFNTLDAQTYLMKYGYWPANSYCRSMHSHCYQKVFKRSLRKFQKFANLESTAKFYVPGLLDNVTKKKMLAPRCGLKDIGEGRKTRRKRYSIEGSYWSAKNVSYTITRYSKELLADKTDLIIDKSFKVWENHSPLKFHRVNNGAANIEIAFANYAHGDGESFDGRGGILAHAFFPRYGGSVHFDDDESWGALENKGIDLYSVAAHEIGHALGLKHSESNIALMAPFYQGYFGDTIYLQLDDIKGLQKIYGKPIEEIRKLEKSGLKRFFYEKIDLYAKSDENSKIYDSNFDICQDPSIDAITVLGNGSTYAFKGNLYWRLNQLSYDQGYPRNISQDWPDLPNDIDAALTDISGDAYFFKGDEFWLFDSNGRVYSGYPKKIHKALPDIPESIDAAMLWTYDGKPYFFKGDKYWKYSRYGFNRNAWPRSTSEISASLPHKIDAALSWVNGKNYLFSGPYYYRVTGWRVMKLISSYPRKTGEWWFGCPQTEENKGERAKRSIRNYEKK